MSSNASNRREQLRRQQEAADRQRRINRWMAIGAGAVALVLIGVFGFVLVQNLSGPRVAQVVPPNVNADQTAFVLNEAPAPAGAPVVTLYLDYQCPNCKTFEQNYGQMLESEAQAGTWTLQTKTMTFMDQNLGNTASTRASVAATCSAVVGKYNEFNREIYNYQAVAEVRGAEGYSDETLRTTIPGVVGITGAELTTYQQCYDDEATSDFVEKLNRVAYEDGVQGTPTLAVNGKILDLRGLTDGSPEGLKAYILANA